MLTYNIENIEIPLYEHIYKCIKTDILSGSLKAGEKLPSKRTFAYNHGISTITIQNAYDQLISEGYVYTEPKKGYFVSEIKDITNTTSHKAVSYNITIPEARKYNVNFAENHSNPDSFPFSVWNKLSRAVMTEKKEKLMAPSPVCGITELRESISNHLASFRGMMVDPNQIIIGAGTEYLYGLLTELLGDNKIYTIENPGYKKLMQIYAQRKIECHYANLDEQGVMVSELDKTCTDVAHICPNHHFPSGITMPAKRRYEILAWANKKSNRYIIEDDYDSEFRTEGKPIPPLFSIDACEKVIYMNTFSKSLTPTIRISYMVLPSHLAQLFYKKMSFYSCTVSNFEQYTLSEFIKQGYFEKHINRMRLFYMRRRNQIIKIIKENDNLGRYEILENDSGLHFLLKIDTTISDQDITHQLQDYGIKITAVSDYYFGKTAPNNHMFIINYSNVNIEAVSEALGILGKIIA